MRRTGERFARLLLGIALVACPREFRREYGDEIAAELEDRSPAPVALAAILVNIAWTGILLRVETLARDAGFAIRTLAKSPAFVIVSIVAIALAIGVNVAVGSLTEQILLRPVPYAHAERLVYVFSTLKGARSDETSYPDLVDLAARNRTFAVLSGATGTSGTLTGRGEPLSLSGAAIAAGYFDVLGIKPEIGRLLGASDLGKRRIVISDDLWHKRFAADPLIAGTEATIDGVAYTIAGVAPPHASTPSPNGFLREQDYWVALDPHAEFARARGWYAIESIGRLGPGVTVAGANADLTRIASDLAREYPGTDRDRGVRVTSLADAIIGEETPILLLIQAGVFMVFLIAAANVSSLLLARATAREHEMLTRMALGATRWRIALQVGVETAILATAGSVLGAIVGLQALAWLHDRVAAMQPAGTLFPGWDRLGLDGPLLCYVVALAAAFTFGVGLLPALVTRTQLASALGGGRQRQDGRHANRLRRLLVVAEMAMAFVLVIMAGLLVRSFVTLDRVGTGYDGKNLYWVEAGSLPSDRYRSNAAERSFFTQLGARLRAIPGVAAVGESSIMLLNDNEDTAYRLAGDRDGAPPRFANINVVAPRYFRALGVPLLRGRDFSAFDRATTQPVAIVSRRFALHAFGTLNVVGREVGVSMSSDGTYPLRRIVGVVGDVRHGLMRAPALEIYAPLDQIAWSRGFVVRTKKAFPGLAASVAAVVRSMDPLLPPPAVDSYATIRGLDAMPVSMTAVVLATLAIIALLLALSGIYGVVAFSVARRTREFGIRIALGAQTGRVLVSVVGESLMLTTVAVVAGLALCLPTTRALGEFLVDTSPLDPVTICGVTVLIFFCSIAASVGPARRAMSTDPATALRYE